LISFSCFPVQLCICFCAFLWSCESCLSLVQTMWCDMVVFLLPSLPCFWDRASVCSLAGLRLLILLP
jgi:hypothetical protein